MSAYDSVNILSKESLPLSRHALVNGGQPFFLIDGTTYIILYLSAANADLSARPAKESMQTPTPHP